MTVRIAVVLVAVTCSLVAARENAPEGASDNAREWYQAGVDLYEREEYAPALDAFRRAFALVPRPQLHFNMARCLSRLGRHRDAVAEFRNAVRSEDLSDEERTRARAELLVEQGNLGTLEVAGEGTVRVDGEPCDVPCTLELDPGEHRVEGEGRVQMIVVERGRVAHAVFTTEPVDEPVPPPERGPYRPGVGTVIGASLLAIGAGGTIGFGLRTRSLEDDFDRAPTDALADDGEQAKLLTNLSIGVAIVGALVWLTEILVGSMRVRETEDDIARGVRPSAW